MLFLIFIAVFASAARGISDLEPEDCNPDQLDVCVERLPAVKQFGIPRNHLELDNHCKAYHMGMGCMDAWVARCMPGDKQRVIGKQTAGARSLMALMCNSTAFQKEYLKEKACWPVVSSDLSRCIDQLHEGAHDVSERAPSNINAQLCCVRDEFDRCVWTSARMRCALTAARLLRRMTRVLSADVAVCPASTSASAHVNTDDAYVCAAPAPSSSLTAAIAAAVLTLWTINNFWLPVLIFCGEFV